MWQDTKFGVKYFSDVERLAIVGEKRWHEAKLLFCKSPYHRAKFRN